jgi:ABC-type amino acid transport substrate-binding protein
MEPRDVANLGRYLLLVAILLLDPVQADQTPNRIRVGIYNNPPLVTTNQAGSPTGLFIDVLEEIASKEGWKLYYVAGTWSDSLQRLSTGKIDLLPAIAVNKERELEYLFIEQSLLSNWAQIFVPENSPIQSIPDLDGKTIAVLRDDIYVTGEHGLNTLCESFLVICHVTEYDTYDRVLRAVTQGKADAGLVNRLFGATHAPGAEIPASGTAAKTGPQAIIRANRQPYTSAIRADRF